jgi:hypothetical protein
VRSISEAIFNFLSPLHVSAQTDHLQKEHRKPLQHYNHPAMINPILHVVQYLNIGNWIDHGWMVIVL